MQTLIDGIANLLRGPGEMLRQITLDVPHPLARAFFIFYFCILAYWVLRMDESEVCGKLPGRDKPIDLRPYAAVALVGQIIIYSIFS